MRKFSSKWIHSWSAILAVLVGVTIVRPCLASYGAFAAEGGAIVSAIVIFLIADHAMTKWLT